MSSVKKVVILLRIENPCIYLTLDSQLWRIILVNSNKHAGPWKKKGGSKRDISHIIKLKSEPSLRILQSSYIQEPPPRST